MLDYGDDCELQPDCEIIFSAYMRLSFHGLRVCHVPFGKLPARCHVPFCDEWLPPGHYTRRPD